MSRLPPLAPFWQRPTDSRTPVRSPATLAGLTIYPTASQHGVFSARVGVATKTKSPLAFSHRAFCSGDVLLSHGLSPYYHRGCSVSLPCSEWERVGPLRYCHQSAEPHWQSRCCRSDASTRPILWGRRPPRRTPHNFSPRSATAATTYSKEHEFQSAIANRKSAILLVLWYLHTGPTFAEALAGKSKSYNARLCFVFEIICLLCVPSFAVANDGLTEKEMIKPNGLLVSLS